MLTSLKVIAEAVAAKPHSFDHIRTATGVKLTDEQFVAMIDENPERFKLVHFLKHDDEGKKILPGRPGMRIRASL